MQNIKIILVCFALLPGLVIRAQTPLYSTASGDNFLLHYPGNMNRCEKGQSITFLADHTITAATPPITITINGLTPQSILNTAGANLAAGDIKANQVVTIVYDGAKFQMTSTSGNAVGGVANAAGFLENNGSGTLAWVTPGGSVNSVSATAPLSSSGGSNPNISLLTVPIASGGTNGSNVPMAGTVAYGTGTQYGFTAVGSVGNVLTSNGAGTPTWQNVTGTLSGGTAFYVPKWLTTTTLSSTSLIYDNGSDVGINTGTPGALFDITGKFQVDNNGNIIRLNSVNTSFPAANLPGALTNDGSGNLSWGQINLGNNVTGILPLNQGGTNAALAVINGGIVYSSASGLAITSAGALGQVLTSNGAAAPSWQAASGGTVTSFSTGSAAPLFTATIANSTTTPSLSFVLSTAGPNTILGNNTAGAAAPFYFSPILASTLFQNQGTLFQVLHGNVGGNPSWGQVTLTTDVSGILPVTNGGTGLAAGISGGILGYTAVGTLASSALLVAHAVLLGGGAGATPTAMGSLGLNGQVLTSSGAGVPPTWVTPTGVLSGGIATTIPVWSSANSLANSSITDGGVIVNINEPVNINYSGSATSALKIASPSFATLGASLSVANNASMSLGSPLASIGFGDAWSGYTAYIAGFRDAVPGASNFPTALTFNTTPAGSGVTSERMRINNAGNMGIGTTSPIFLLDVSSNAGNNFGISSYSTPPIFVGRYGTGTMASPGAPVAGNSLLFMSGRGYNGSSFSSDQVAIKFAAGENWSTTANGTYMTFSTTPITTTTLTEQMRITNSGNLGIGTITPLQKLTVYGSTSYGQIQTLSTAPGAESDIGFNDGTANIWLVGQNIGNTTNKFSIYSELAGASLLTILPAGNVGIGTATPGALLDIETPSSASVVEGMRIGNPSAGSSGTYMTFRNNSPSSEQSAIAGYFDAVTSQTLAFFTGNAHTERMRITGTGNVGIGTTNPGNPLNVYQDADVWHLTLGGASGQLDIGGQTASGAVIQAYVPGGAVRDLYLERDGGKVGIGTNAPGYPLDVEAVNAPVQTFNAGKYGTNVSATVWTSAFTTNLVTPSIAIKASGYIWSTIGFLASSDNRAKENIINRNSEEALTLIGKLNPVKFNWIDRTKSAQLFEDGFIAQEVEEIYPQAVTKQTSWIPNIYELAENVKFDAPTRTLVFTISKPAELKAGDRIKIITQAKPEVVVNVFAIKGNSVIVKDWTDSVTSVFVYGKEVNDFRIVNYDRIFTLGISAIQELIKRDEKNTEHFKQLEMENDFLKQSNATYHSEIDQLKAEFEEMKIKLGMQPVKVSVEK